MVPIKQNLLNPGKYDLKVRVAALVPCGERSGGVLCKGHEIYRRAQHGERCFRRE